MCIFPYDPLFISREESMGFRSLGFRNATSIRYAIRAFAMPSCSALDLSSSDEFSALSKVHPASSFLMSWTRCDARSATSAVASQQFALLSQYFISLWRYLCPSGPRDVAICLAHSVCRLLITVPKFRDFCRRIGSVLLEVFFISTAS